MDNAYDSDSYGICRLLGGDACILREIHLSIPFSILSSFVGRLDTRVLSRSRTTYGVQGLGLRGRMDQTTYLSTLGMMGGDKGFFRGLKPMAVDSYWDPGGDFQGTQGSS